MTTTDIFANEIIKFNKNVVVFPNAINPKEPQFNQPTVKSDRIRVGWLGGSSHLHDLMLLQGFTQKNGSEINNKIQYVICGFDTRGSVTEINPQTGEQKRRDILPHETVWSKYEEIFTNNYNLVDEDYKKFLIEYKEGDYVSNKELPYVRVWTKPVTSYAMNYSKLDISLSPIKNHIFNRMKSQLKVIEAGFYKKALIASEIGPYTIDLKHCLKNGNFVDGNAMLVPEHRNHSDWSKHIKKLIQNPNLITDMGERLYETVKDKYDLNNVTKDRAEFYKSLIK
jgi:glycosyltransferase involved in cell wall biosynthesis